MKHSARDFARAEFARHPQRFNKAMRREDVNTDQPWLYLVGNAFHRRSDAEMADEGWEPIQTTSDPVPVPMIREPYDLMMFRNQHGVREDWHEPDNQNISARIIGRHLDNAMGSTTRHEHTDWGGEFNVVLTRMDETDREIQEDLAVVNLATLLSWAAQYGEAQR